MRLNPLYPSDNPLYESLYCFGSGDTGGDAGDVESGKQGMGPAASGPQKSLGASSNVADYSSDDSDRRVQSTGSTTNFNIDRSQPSVSTDSGRVYGTQENLDRAIASGDLDVTPSAIDSYTPGTEQAQSAFTAAGGIMPQDRSAQAAAGPALSGSAGDFEGVSFAPTSITSQAAAGPALSGGYSPVTRGMSPFEMSLAESLGPRPDYVSSVRMGNFDDPEVQRTMAELDAISARMGGNPYGPSPQQTMSPVDAVNIFDQFDQPLDASVDPSRPDLARDPSRPAVSIVPGARPGTPAENVLSQAGVEASRAAADQARRSFVDAAFDVETRLGAQTPGLQEAIAGGVMPANIEGRYGMQPTTPEVDAYNQAINEQIAGQLGVDSYSPGSFNAMKEVQDRALAGQFNVAGLPGAEIPGATRPMDFSDIEAADARDQGIMAAVNAAREVELETGVPAQEVAGIIGASRAATDLLSGYDRMMAEQRAVANRDQMAAEMAAAQGTPERGLSVAPTREGLNDIDRAVAEEEAFRAAQGPLDTNQFQEQAEDETIYGGRGTATPQAATLTDTERMSQQTADAEEFTGYGREDLANAQAELEAARAQAYGDKQFGFDTGLPSSMDIFGTQVPTGVGVIEGIADAVFQPDAALANAIAERGIRTIDGNPVPEGTANYNPQGLDVVTAGGPIGEGGRTAAYDASGNIVYDSSPFSGLNPFGEGVPENIQELYDRQRTIEDEERARSGDGGGAPILPPIAEKPPEDVTPEEYKGRDVVKPYQYQARGPLSYSYTGLPSLAPTRLRPSYQASKRFSPLFPVS